MTPRSSHCVLADLMARIISCKGTDGDMAACVCVCVCVYERQTDRQREREREKEREVRGCWNGRGRMFDRLQKNYFVFHFLLPHHQMRVS